MLLDRFISKSNFSSYEDFYKNFRIHTPSHFNFAYDVVDEIACIEPRKVALVWCDEKGDERIFTFEDMKKYSSRAAHFFKSCGIKKGDRVLLLLKRRYEFWFCLLGLHRIGAVCVPASQMLTAKDIMYRNNAAGIKMIVVVNDLEIIQHVEDAEADSPTVTHKVLIGAKRSGWIDVDLEHSGTLDYYERSTGKDAIHNEDSMLIYFTSGTTGMPKMVQHNFTYPLGHIITAKYWQCVQDNKLHLTLAETGWAKAMWGKIYGQWLCGAVVFVYDFDRFSSKNLLHIISRWKVATFCAPPTVYRMLFEEDFTRYDLSSLEYCSIAGEAYDRVVFEEFHKRTGLLLKEAYGQTETTVVLGTFPWMDSKPCSMGKPAPGYMVEILNEKGGSCLTGEKGEIAIRVDDCSVPSGLFSSYQNDPEYTASVWHDGFYFTGDIAWRDADGYYWFVGRADNMIKSSGYRIGPFEVESVLLEHPAVRECVVSGVPDIDRGQAVKATIVLNENYQPGKQLIKELQDYVKTITAPYKYPRFIEFAEKIPRTGSGKLKRCAK